MESAPLPKTSWCNPLALPSLGESLWVGNGVVHRQASDPSVYRENGVWYLFSSCGFLWTSADDGATWRAEPNPQGFRGWGPGAATHNGRYYYMPDIEGTIFVADKPGGPYTKLGKVEMPDVPGIVSQADANLFSDNGHLYYQWGCSAQGGIWGCELDAENPLKVIAPPRELIGFDPVGQPWEKLANMPENGWIEGASMVKLRGRYGLIFSAGGTENQTYAMGAAWSDSPLGPFVLQKDNPVFINSTGFVTGTGHGCIVPDERGRLWAFSCCLVGDVHKFERRIAMDRIFLDDHGDLIPAHASSVPQAIDGSFAWARIPVETDAVAVADEKRNTYAEFGPSRTIECQFRRPTEVRAFRICWREGGYDPRAGVPAGPFRYRVHLKGLDGSWTVYHDASESTEDLLVDFRETAPQTATAVRLELVSAPAGIRPGVFDFALFQVAKVQDASRCRSRR